MIRPRVTILLLVVLLSGCVFSTHPGGWETIDPYSDGLADLNFEADDNPFPRIPTGIGNGVGLLAGLPLAVSGLFFLPFDAEVASRVALAGPTTTAYLGGLLGLPFVGLNYLFYKSWAVLLGEEPAGAPDHWSDRRFLRRPRAARLLQLARKGQKAGLEVQVTGLETALDLRPLGWSLVRGRLTKRQLLVVTCWDGAERWRVATMAKQPGLSLRRAVDPPLRYGRAAGDHLLFVEGRPKSKRLARLHDDFIQKMEARRRDVPPGRRYPLPEGATAHRRGGDLLVRSPVPAALLNWDALWARTSAEAILVRPLSSVSPFPVRIFLRP